MYPTPEQIKALLTLPTEQAVEGALLFSGKITKALTELTERAKLLDLVMTNLANAAGTATIADKID